MPSGARVASYCVARVTGPGRARTWTRAAPKLRGALEVTFGPVFGKRRAAKAQARDDAQPTDPADDAPVDAPPAHEEGNPGEDRLTLSTMCACGHIRRDHRGLRMDLCGGCWECDCDEFRPVSEPLQRIQALLARVERLQESVAGLRSQARANGTRVERTHRGGSDDGHPADGRVGSRDGAEEDRPAD